MSDMQTIAARNLRSFIRNATFKNGETDRDAANVCVDVLTENTTPANPAQGVSEAIKTVEYICGRFEKNQGASSLTIAVRSLLAAIGAGGQAVADIVPDGCSGSSLAFSEGVLHVSKDGSGYIAVNEDDWRLEDDRCEGPDGPEGSVRWITRFPAGEMQALRDFLNGADFANPPAQPGWRETPQRIKAAMDAWEALTTTNEWFAQREAGKPTTNTESAIFLRISYSLDLIEAAFDAASPLPGDA